MPTITQALGEGAERLRSSAVDQERRTAGLLLGHTLSLDAAQLLVRSEEKIGDPEYRLYLGFVERRAAGEPLQYITGRQEFFGLEFKVTPDVLIPRPETEHLVEQVIKLSREQSSRDRVIADIGTGSGCIAVSLAVNIPGSTILATDISPAALQVAIQNAKKHSVADRIEFLEGDLLSPLKSRDLEGNIDFIASNPPYVPAIELDHLQREVRDHEPALALFGGPDGLDCYRRLLSEAPAFLRAGGGLICEIGFGQLKPIENLVDPAVWLNRQVINDLQGIPRTLVLRLRA